MRNVVGLQATAREWRRKECFEIINEKRKNGFMALNVSHNSDFNFDSLSSLYSGGDRMGMTNDDIGGGVYATAHHADDQQETILLKFLRGAHISHLQPVCKSIVVHLLFSPKI